MLLVIYLLFILVAIAVKQSRFLGIAFAAFLWILFGWSSKNADSAQYLMKYNAFATYQDSLEFLFSRVFSFFKAVGFSYQGFLITFSLIFLVSFLVFSSKLTKNWLFVLGLYAIYPFMMDVVQVRNSMALPFVWFALYQILHYKSKKEVVKAALSIGIASLFHSSALIFLILLVVPYITRKTSYVFAIFTSIFGIFLTPYMGPILASVAQQFHVLARLQEYSSLTAAAYQLDMRKLVIIATLFISYFLAIQLIQSSSYLRSQVSSQRLQQLEKMNALLLVVVPLVGFIPDIYRAYSALAIVNYGIWAQALSTRPLSLRINRDEFWFRHAVVFFAFINIYLLVLSSVNIDTVFRPLFDNNLLFGNH